MKLLSDMRKNSLIIAVLSIFVGVSCSMARHHARAPIRQGIAGQILWVTGNRMPSPDAPLPPPKGIRCSLYVHHLTSSSQVTRAGNGGFFSKIGTPLVKSLESDEEGNFSVELPEGSYSVFMGAKGMFYANISDHLGQISPVYVQKDSITRVQLQLDYQAVY